MPTSISIPSRATSSPFDPTSSIAATNIQNAIAELAQETVDLFNNQTIGGIKNFSGGAINLINATNNLLVYTNAGVDVPTFNTRSLGTKVVLRSGLSSTATEYALGIGDLTLWSSLAQGTINHFFKWFGGTTEIASLRGDGLFSVPKLTVASVDAWTAVTFQNSWANFFNTHATAAYRKLPDGSVEVKGLVTKSTTPTAGEVIFTLPVGFRPLETRMFPTISNNALGRVDVLNNGNVVFSLGSNVWFSLQTIRFTAEQ